MKKVLILSLAILFIFLLKGTALANYGVHGKPENTAPPFFGSDYENVWECAGCHRGHTGSYTNLLFTSAASTWGFCSSCHGAAGTGANTNVEEGVYQTGRGRSSSVPADSSTPGGTLNGGGFLKLGGPTGNPFTSRHDAYSTDDTILYTAWGGGTGAPGYKGPGYIMPLICTSCHDPHGSTNYRVLKDSIPNPQFPAGLNQTDYVESNETAFETGGYSPDYTSPKYRMGDTPAEGISYWCASCHTQHVERLSLSYDPEGTGTPRLVVRHRVNVGIGEYKGKGAPLTTTLPLETAPGVPSDLYQIGCLTCHRAHGTDRNVDQVVPNPSPANSSTLLRLNNRGVCQNCHKR